MPTNRKDLSVNSIEFDDIKKNFKTFLRGQEIFKDYDYDGSALSVLIDLLSYNTYYQAFYNNVAANEMFLDSAVKRSSLVSIAKNLGYTPNSVTAPTAIVDVVYGASPSATSILPGEQFTINTDAGNFVFVNTESAEIKNVNSQYVIEDLEIKEGYINNISYIVPDTENNRKYVIPDENADISTITVRVQTSQTDTTGLTDTWNKISDITQLTPETKVFFLEENTLGYYEIYFGDNVLGQKLEAGNLIRITYLVTSGSSANGSGKNNTFRYLNDSNTVTVKSIALGGAEKESTDTIRFRAPRYFSAQNRAVTENDYASLIENNFSGFDSVFIFGGEEAEPPTYGSVFVAIKPQVGTMVGDSKKKSIEKFLSTKAVLGVKPIVIDPDYTYMIFHADVSYDTSKTSLSSGSITSIIRTSIINNIDSNLGKFNRAFSISKLLTEIDSGSSSIESSSVLVTMEKRFLPTSTNLVSYRLDYGNSIYHPHDGHKTEVYSNNFLYLDPEDTITKTVFLEDDGYGNISFYRFVEGIKETVAKNIGTVDYTKGIVTINEVQVLSPLDNPYIRVFARANNKRYVSIREKLLVSDYENDSSAILVTLNGIDQYKGTVFGTSSYVNQA